MGMWDLLLQLYNANTWHSVLQDTEWKGGWWWRWSRASCPRMSVDILGTSWDQCVSMVQYCFTSTETRRLVRTGSPGRPPQLSRSSWTLKVVPQLIFCFPRPSDVAQASPTGILCQHPRSLEVQSSCGGPCLAHTTSPTPPMLFYNFVLLRISTSSDFWLPVPPSLPLWPLKLLMQPVFPQKPPNVNCKTSEIWWCTITMLCVGFCLLVFVLFCFLWFLLLLLLCVCVCVCVCMCVLDYCHKKVGGLLKPCNHVH